MLTQFLSFLQMVILSVLPFISQLPSNDIRVWTPILMLVATFITTMTQKAEFENRQKASASVLLFWTFQLLCTVVTLYGWLIREEWTNEELYIGCIVVMGAIAGTILYLEANVYEPKKKPKNRDIETSDPAIVTESPYDNAHLLSRAYCSWMRPFLQLGNTRVLKINDLPPPPTFLRAQNLHASFQDTWSARQKDLPEGEIPSVLGTLVVQYFPSYLGCAFFYLISIFTPFIQPFLLRSLIIFVSDYQSGHAPLARGFSIVAAMVIAQLGSSLCYIQGFLRAQALQTKLTTALTATIHDKALRLSSEAVEKNTTGEIVSIMSSDIYRVGYAIDSFDVIWRAPLEVFICWSSMYFLIGNAMWVGILVMVALLPVTAVISKIRYRLFNLLRAVRTRRYDATNDCMTNIKSIKLYAWEKVFYDKVLGIRNDEEFALVKKTLFVKNVERFVWRTATTFSSAAAFAYFALIMNRRLTTDIAFPALSLFGILMGPFGQLPYVLNQFAEAKIALNKIGEFLRATEVDKGAVARLPSHPRDVSCQSHDHTLPCDATCEPTQSTAGEPLDDSRNVVVARDASFTWDSERSVPLLHDLNFSAQRSSLVCVVGRVGTGKTGFLLSLLGDTFKTSGSLTTYGSIAYVSQQPWILNATVKDNILFGSKFDANFYSKVLEACALSPDLKLLPDGHMTEVGEKGISLSGGQKARLALARAVYSRADIILMDDVLAAVDEHVQHHLITHVIGSNGLLKSKTKILATNTVNALEHADKIYLIEEGTFAESGSYDEVMEGDGKLKKLIKEFGKQASYNESYESAIEEAAEEAAEELDDESELPDISHDRKESFHTLRRASTVSHVSATVKPREDVRKTRVLDEVTTFGSVKSSVYFKFFDACGWFNVSMFLFFTILTNFGGVAASLWIKFWGDQAETTSYAGQLIDQQTGFNSSHNFTAQKGFVLSQADYALGYLMLGISSGFFLVIASIFWYSYGAIRASKTLFTEMLVAVLNCPMSFFESTPIGRITNRFSSDIAVLDNVIPSQVESFVGGVSSSFTSILVIAVSAPMSLVVIIPTLLVYRSYQQFYVATTREVRRLASAAHSPVISHFQETLTGLVTVRAYFKQRYFSDVRSARMDVRTKCNFMMYCLSCWLTLRLALVGGIILFASGMALVASLSYRTMSAGTVGLAMTYALRVGSSLNQLVMLAIRMETQSVAVERIIEYTELPSEGKSVVVGSEPVESSELQPLLEDTPDEQGTRDETRQVTRALVEEQHDLTNWPQGEIAFVDYSTRYRPQLDNVLNEVSFTIKKGQKVGVVGRTGAGKSSLTMSLFRIIEASSGKIVIDGIDISTLSQEKLRSKLSIIPQDAQMFEGTIRTNLDPAGKYSDTELWKVLELSSLKTFVQSQESGLDTKLSEGGGNLSVGQKQLMCLGRALLNPSPILVLDEATASVDVETDRTIQETIRSQFKHKTIITIAHRLNTIMDSDMILVLHEGRVMEFEHPDKLLAKKEGLFYDLCKQAGLV